MIIYLIYYSRISLRFWIMLGRWASGSGSDTGFLIFRGGISSLELGSLSISVSGSGSVVLSSSGLKPSSWRIGEETKDCDRVFLFFWGFYNRGHVSTWSNHKYGFKGSNRPILGLWCYSRPLLGLEGWSDLSLDFSVIVDLSSDWRGDQTFPWTLVL